MSPRFKVAAVVLGLVAAFAVATPAVPEAPPTPGDASDSGIPATFRFTVDNALEAMYVNGVAVDLPAEGASDWTISSTMELRLQPGKNVIALQCIDLGVIAGLLGELRVGVTTLVTDESWRYHAQPAGDWWEIDYDDRHWPAAVVHAGYDEGVWAGRFSGMEDLDPAADWIWSSTNYQDYEVDPAVTFRLTFELQPSWEAIHRASDTWIKEWEDWAQGAVEVRHYDLNEDGEYERIEYLEDRGSGWGRSYHCIRDGTSGHTACEETAYTTYNPASGVGRWPLEPRVGNRALELFEPLTCEQPDPSSSSQGAMWQLTRPNPLQGEIAVDDPAWLPGRPVAQDTVCMSVETAETLAGGMGWNDGAMDDPGGWTVIYPGRAAHHPQDIQDRSREPYKAGKVGRYRIYRHSHALAIYDPGKNRHAWIYNAGWDEDGFKTDRWERIVGLTESDDGNLVLEINRGVVTNTVVLTLP